MKSVGDRLDAGVRPRGRRGIGILQLDYEWDDEKAWTEYVSNIHGCSEVRNTINEQVQKWLQEH